MSSKPSRAMGLPIPKPRMPRPRIKNLKKVCAYCDSLYDKNPRCAGCGASKWIKK